MSESVFYELLNHIMSLSQEDIADMKDKMNELFDSLIYNTELINEVKNQLRLEGISLIKATEKKEEVLADMRALGNTIEFGKLEDGEVRKELFQKVINVTGIIYDKALEDFNRAIMQVPVELCHPKAQMPKYAHKEDAGFDFYLPEGVTIKAHEYGKIVKTGLKMAIPAGYELQIRPRSGNSVKTTLRIANAPGTIDCGYADEIGIICDNIGDEDIVFEQGDRIAQGVFAEIPKGLFNQVDDINTVTGANRGGGFGSTGK